MVNHGIYVSRGEPSTSIPTAAESGIPFVIGAAPVHMASAPAKIGVPVLCESWEDVEAKLGYSDDWDSFNLSEFAYAYFKLYGCKPVVFCNLFDPASMKTAVTAADKDVANHQVVLPGEAIKDSGLTVKASGGTGTAYVAGTDYEAYYADGKLIIEVLEDGACYEATSLSVAYNKVTPTQLTAAKVAAGLENTELCMSATGHAPDLLCAPGYSGDSAVAAAMALKASGINGMFHAKALVDIAADSTGATTLDNAITYKQTNLADKNEIVCWPMVMKDGRKYHMSTHLAGVMAQTDSGNDGCPYESPSSKAMACDAMVLKDGTEVLLSQPQANKLNAQGIVTGLAILGNLVVWGNYTACYPTSKAAEEYSSGLLRQRPNEAPYWGPVSVTGSYVGTGGYGSDNPNSLAFDDGEIPNIIVITAQNRNFITLAVLFPYAGRGITFNDSDGNGSPAYRLEVSISGKAVSWYSPKSAALQANNYNITFVWHALCK